MVRLPRGLVEVAGAGGGARSPPPGLEEGRILLGLVEEEGVGGCTELEQVWCVEEEDELLVVEVEVGWVWELVGGEDTLGEVPPGQQQAAEDLAVAAVP